MSQELSDNEDGRMSLSEPEQPENVEEPEDANNKENEDNEDNEEGRKINPSASKKIIRREIPKLNPARLKGPKGVTTIEKYFEGFKFHGKGHEKADLNRVMKRLEHWAHRLFPKYQFDDFLEKVEALGSKKDLQTHLTKYRKDMLSEDLMDVEENEEREELGEEERARSPGPVDEFDLLIAEQIERTKQVSSQLGKRAGGEPDEEMKRRMEANRKLAMERRLAKMREATAAGEGSQLDGTAADGGVVLETTGEAETGEGSQSVQANSAPVDDVDEEEEIRKRIERNRQMAVERRLAKMKQREMEMAQNAEATDVPLASGPELAEEKQSQDTSQIMNISSSGPNKTLEEPVPSKRQLLTDEELDKEIGAAVDMFIKGNRSSLQ